MILLHPSIDPVIFSLGFFEIRWYGLAYIVSFLICGYLMKSFNNKLTASFNSKLIDDFFIWSIIGVVIGGRIGYVLFYQLNFFQEKINLYLVINVILKRSLRRLLRN